MNQALDLGKTHKKTAFMITQYWPQPPHRHHRFVWRQMLLSAPSPAGNSALQQENVVCYPETKLKKNINQGRILSNDSQLSMISKIVLVLQWGFSMKTADFLAKIICSEQTQDPRHCGFKIYIIDLYKDLKQSTRLIWI